ncbi:3-phenylpropionate/trans-cinnamate dioxygenase ferredoxin reductase subunit [Rhodoblastus acidophilus]|uniref:2Fe-2S iron-sulfur cluster binding domain-containing protein n=1 Tax=Rhodoblastus acidophilus TaxID=1074 RepID=UPI002224954E|nr:2Fe-2S iron-sulfur cluster binding domain-containing protein [Rhodoblastus acidophilus]MCW2285395.1 3-phenylpropionate/trans-cinnamate dioxygenase ferredoxin reductase subunit [Rhodoblastus acidophilus]MCW2334357.1 3-phenylpropionate/trans-cinnamate dioxygenase ferredoxin reductase subunit [Rhodoblastus acidophilus]
MKTFQVSIGEMGSFRAKPGENLLDAALMNGIDMPHDCRSGTCGSCRCTLSSGSVEGGETDSPGAVLACQAKVMSDLEIIVEETPPVETFGATVKALRDLSVDITEVTLAVKGFFEMLPGQYVQVKFAGFPARCYSPTAPLEGPVERGTIRLQIKRVRDGRVSSALGQSIRPGHKAKVVGPYGSAWLRPGQTNRLVLVASGAGFAPIWSIAHAALCEMPDREIVVVVGAGSVADFYMAPALWRLVAFPKTQVISVLRHADRRHPDLPAGSPVDFIPALSSHDIVYACGAPRMVEAVGAIARASGATCHSDPFVPAHNAGDGFWDAFSRAIVSPLQLLRRSDDKRATA